MKNEILWYRKSAKDFVHGIPLGNGRLGAVVTGGVAEERINLNEETLWSGFPRTNSIDNAYDRFVRRLRKKILEEGDDYGAEDLADRLQGPYTESYLSAGELVLEIAHGDTVSDYRRGLDMRRGVSFTAYRVGDVTYTREYFCTAADGLIVLRLRADKEGALSFTATLDSMIRHETVLEEDTVILSGRAPRHVEPQYLERGYGDPQAIVYDEVWEDSKGLRFCEVLRAVPTDGTLTRQNGALCLSGATDCVLLLWLGTDFKPTCRISGNDRYDYRDKELDLAARGRAVISAAVAKGYETILSCHEADMRALFDRVSLSLAYDKALDELPTDERKARYDGGASDAGLEKQMFDFGRYLLYSCSRVGTEAANLQGIWCWLLRPQWSCNYTLNINTQMNYWGAEVLNLPECHLPLFTFLRDLARTGKTTAQSLYRARGFCVHHNTDLWRCALPIGMGESDSKWSLFPTAGVWLALHIMEHYRFTGDRAFLSEYFPVLKGACLFALDMLCEMQGGALGICPATVPERRFTTPAGDEFSVGVGSTFDYELLHELFDDAREAIALLALPEEELLAEMDAAQKRFPALPTDKNGIIADWQRDAEPEPYLWVNVLFGLYPGRCLQNEKLLSAAAVRRTLAWRDAPSNTFSNTWSAGAWARLKEGERAYRCLRHHSKRAMLNSLLGINRNGGGEVFQIDANLGAIAAFAEMLLQSDEHSITLLPALPAEWKSGEIRDFCTRSGVRVTMRFEDGAVRELTLFATRDAELVLRANGQEIAIRVRENERKTVIKEGVCYE